MPDKIPFFHHYFDIFQLLGEILDIRRAKLYIIGTRVPFLNEILTFSSENALTRFLAFEKGPRFRALGGNLGTVYETLAPVLHEP